jgi:hypothetical protein
MKRFLPVLPVLLLVLGSSGCHSQQPVSTYGIAYTATAPVTCTTASPCQIEYSDTPQVSGACPAAIPTVGCTSVSGATACTHAAVTPGVTYCAVAQTVQAGATSVPTAVIQVVIPTLPTAPASPSGSATPSTVAEVLHDTSTELALNKDGSLRITRNFVVNVATK